MDADVVIAAVITILGGYLIGSIPVANLVARHRASIDLRDVGDRNPGYWNAKETLGRRAAVPVFVGDSLKGVSAALVALGVEAAFDLDVWGLPYAGTGAAMVGHAFPVFAGFRGGRSVLTFAGGAAVYATLPFLAAIAALALASIVTKSFAIGARVGVVAFPVAQLLVEGPFRTAATGVLMTFIGVRFATAAWSARRTL